MTDNEDAHFVIEAAQYEKALAWKGLQMELHPCYSGAIGGRFRYSFCETSIGYIVTLHDDHTGETLDLTGDL